MSRRNAGWWGRVDWVLAGLVATLSGLGIANLFSAADATYGMPVHLSQSLWFSIGSVVALVTAVIDYKWFERWAYLIFGAIASLLVAVLLVGTELNGSYRWLNFGAFMMQPSELLKIGVVLFAGRYLSERSFPQGMGLKDLAVPCGIVGAAVFLVLKQPDLGTSLVILAIFGSVLLYQGLRTSTLMTLIVVGMLSIPVVWNFGMHDYQRARVVSFMNLDADTHGDSWQVRQSIIAFGSGRLWGKGDESTQIQKGFVPEHENDFVAANFGEERGFVGMAFLLGLYFALIVWGLRIASRSRDKFGAILAVGVSASVFWHVVVNLGMVTGMLPVVGLTLPFLSAGGSSLLTLMFQVGLLMNVSIRRRAVG